jgi:allene oxide cyclase
MKRVAMKAVSLALAVALVGAVAAWARSGHHGKGSGRALTVIEHATTDATTDTGVAGDTAGDILTFSNQVFDRADAHAVGTDQGYCIRTVAGKSYECNWTTILAGGQITVQGPFLDAGDSTLAVTGGTGRYRNVRGFMKLHSLENGTRVWGSGRRAEVSIQAAPAPSAAAGVAGIC